MTKTRCVAFAIMWTMISINATSAAGRSVDGEDIRERGVNVMNSCGDCENHEVEYIDDEAGYACWCKISKYEFHEESCENYTRNLKECPYFVDRNKK